MRGWDSYCTYVFVCMCVHVQNLTQNLVSKKNESKAIALADVGPSTGLADLEPSFPVAVSWPERSWGLVQMPGLQACSSPVSNSGYILVHMGN